MSRDLEQLLRDEAVAPSAPLDPRGLIARGRRRRRIRHAAIATGSAAVAAVAAVLAAGVLTAPTPPEIVDQPPRPSPSPQVDGDGAFVDEPPTIGPAEAGRPLLVFGESGILRVTGPDEQRLWDAAVAVALPDLRGGVVFQDDGEYGAIRWLPAEAGAPFEPPLVTGDNPTLHAVVDMDGEPTVLFTRRTGDLAGEDQEERLYARGLDSEAERDLGVTGYLESGMGDVGVYEHGLAVSTCHILCRIRLVPAGAPVDSDATTELDGMPHHGLDVVNGVLGYVRTISDDVERTELRLVLHDLATDTRDELPLPTLAARFDGVFARLDLAGDLTAALVPVTWYDWDDDQHRGRTLLVDLATDEVYALATDGHQVRFDSPPVPTTGTEPVTETDERLIADFLRFATDPGPTTFASLPFTSEVLLGLADEVVVSRLAVDLADPAAWVVDVDDFRAYVGPFSALDLAADAGEVEVSVGPHPHCASPPQPAPVEVAGLRRVSVQPATDSFDSCLQWWTVDLFVTATGEIRAVTLDLYEP